MGYISSDNGSRQPIFLTTTSILLLLSTIAVRLRFYCRAIVVRHVGLDDCFMLIALIVVIGMGIMNGFHVSWGTGRHGTDLDLAVILIPTLKHWYAYQIVYPWAFFFVKASILALYHRIFTQTKLRYAIYSVATFVLINTVVVFFVNVFECRSNISQAWSPTFPTGCDNLPATHFTTASMNIVTDIVILAMPLKAFGQLKLHRKKRWALVGVFMVGGIAVVASIVRLYALWVYTVTKDVAYDAIFILLLSQIEVNVAIISASAPSLRPLFRHTFKSSTYDESKRYEVGYGGDQSASNSKRFSRSHRARSNGQIEMYHIKDSGRPRASRLPDDADTRNTSEELILGDDGIFKTVETTIDYRNQDLGQREAPATHCLNKW